MPLSLVVLFFNSTKIPLAGAVTRIRHQFQAGDWQDIEAISWGAILFFVSICLSTHTQTDFSFVLNSLLRGISFEKNKQFVCRTIEPSFWIAGPAMLAIPFCESFAVTWKAEVMSAAKTASPIISPHQNKGGEKRESSPPTFFHWGSCWKKRSEKRRIKKTIE